MKLVRSPLRITLGGGGTDLPSYRKFGGHLISGAIDNMFIALLKPFEKVYLKYSEIEHVSKPEDIRHKIFKEVLSMEESDSYDQIELTTLADIPAGTGLGSSGAFTSALIKCLSLWNGRSMSNFQVAESACHVEIDRLKQPVGKQDQFMSAIGGISEFIFHKDDSVEYNRLPISDDIIYKLEDSICMFFTGITRSANDFLTEQDKKSMEMDKEVLNSLHKGKELASISKDLLIRGDVLQQDGVTQSVHAEIKEIIDQISTSYKRGMQAGIANGALGEVNWRGWRWFSNVCMFRPFWSKSGNEGERHAGSEIQI